MSDETTQDNSQLADRLKTVTQESIERRNTIKELKKAVESLQNGRTEYEQAVQGQYQEQYRLLEQQTNERLAVVENGFASRVQEIEGKYQAWHAERQRETEQKQALVDARRYANEYRLGDDAIDIIASVPSDQRKATAKRLSGMLRNLPDLP